jgi:hypothetical protein
LVFFAKHGLAYMIPSDPLLRELAPTVPCRALMASGMTDLAAKLVRSALRMSPQLLGES